VSSIALLQWLLLSITAQGPSARQPGDRADREFLHHVHARESILGSFEIDYFEAFFGRRGHNALNDLCVVQLNRPDEKWLRYTIPRDEDLSKTVSVKATLEDEILTVVRQRARPVISVFASGRQLVVSPEPDCSQLWVGTLYAGADGYSRRGGLSCGLFFCQEWLSDVLCEHPCISAIERPGHLIEYVYLTDVAPSVPIHGFCRVLVDPNQDYYPIRIEQISSKLPLSDIHWDQDPQIEIDFVSETKRLQDVATSKVILEGATHARSGVTSTLVARVVPRLTPLPSRPTAIPEEIAAVDGAVDYVDQLTGERIHLGIPDITAEGEHKKHIESLRKNKTDSISHLSSTQDVAEQDRIRYIWILAGIVAVIVCIYAVYTWIRK